MPVMQYISRRKLLNALYDMHCGEKMISVALLYGFETQAGFYKAFVREFGYTPTEFLNISKKKKPYRVNLLKEEHIMVSHKKIKEILQNWGLENEKITDIVYAETGNISESACYVGDNYVEGTEYYFLGDSGYDQDDYWYEPFTKEEMDKKLGELMPKMKQVKMTKKPVIK